MGSKLMRVAAVLMFLGAALFVGQAILGSAEAQPANSNSFQSPHSGTDNILLINGTAKVDDVALAIAATFVEGTEASNKFDVQVTWKDGGGTAIAHAFSTVCYASESATGVGVVTTTGTSAFSAVTNGAVNSVTSGTSALAWSGATGLLGVRVTQTSATAPNQYLCCQNAFGMPICSAVLDWS